MSENAILFKWKLNCADKDIVAGYNISYCNVADYDRNVCLGIPYYEFIHANDKNEHGSAHKIASLKPYQQYNISVALISSSKRMGAFSSPIIARTMEACKFLSQKQIIE